MAILAHGVRVSRTSKLDGIMSWSLPAGRSCPGAATASVCAGCYAKTGNYRFANVNAYSTPFGHAFHADSATDSRGIRPGGRSEATLVFGGY